MIRWHGGDWIVEDRGGQWYVCGSPWRAAWWWVRLALRRWKAA